MYFPNGLPKVISTIPQEEDDSFQYLCCNRERILLIILRKYSIAIWQLKPLVQLTAYRRSTMSINNLGYNVAALWRPDSSAIVVQTSQSGLVFFQIDTSIADNGCYSLKDVNNSKRESDELFIKEMIPYISLVSTASLLVGGGITCLESLRDNVIVSCATGIIQRIQWDGTVNEALTIPLQIVPFSVDFPQSKKSFLNQTSIHIVDLDYSFLLGGFSLVLSNGRGALMTATHSDFVPKSVQCVWVPQDTSFFTCTAVNHKFRLMAFGCENSQGAIYCIEDQSEGIQLTHRLELLDKDCPDMMAACGAVEDLNWTPDGCALGMIWQKGGFAIWSVFGALLSFCLTVVHEGIPRTISALDWGSEGYSLWLLDSKMIFSYAFAKSSLTMNNCATNRIYVLLQGDTNLTLNTGDRVIAQSSSASSSPPESTHKLFSNKSWIVIQYPHRYIATNWPIRYAVVDATAETIAIAGRNGLAIYLVSSRKWKTFNNETAEQLFIATGGLIWWRDFVICSCYNNKTEKDEVRFYPRNKTLEHSSSTVWNSQSSVISVNIFRDMLLIFSADYILTLCGLERKVDGVSVLIHPLQLISIENICSHPNCVVSIDLTPVRAETGFKKLMGSREAESLLINVSGRLWIIQRENPSELINSEKNGDVGDNTGSGSNIITPLLLSSCVETLWVHPSLNATRDKPQLSEALWMFCGAHGMKVWVPLFPKDENKKNPFLSRRMMLPVKLKTFPLCVLFDEAMIHGAESDITFESSPVEVEAFSLPGFSLQRTSEVYLPQVLRQLLRRNLGAHALEIAQTCTKLPYFNHSLELLLHQVLEEEGTSSEPTPDPLLPSVVAFVQEFPVFLQTIAHCARKSDIALWPRLFSEAGEPVHLFRECLNSGQLQIAASFLIVLNSTMTPAAVRKQATALMERAREKIESELVSETARFLRALDLEEAEGLRKTPEFSPTAHKPLSRNTSDNLDLITPITPQGASTFKYGPNVRNRTTSEAAQDGASLTKRTSVNIPIKQELVRSYSVVSPPNPAMVHSNSSSPTDNRMDSIDSSVFSNRVPISTSTPSFTSKQNWNNRRRFPGHAQLCSIVP